MSSTLNRAAYILIVTLLIFTMTAPCLAYGRGGGYMIPDTGYLFAGGTMCEYGGELYYCENGALIRQSDGGVIADGLGEIRYLNVTDDAFYFISDGRVMCLERGAEAYETADADRLFVCGDDVFTSYANVIYFNYIPIYEHTEAVTRLIPVYRADKLYGVIFSDGGALSHDVYLYVCGDEAKLLFADIPEFYSDNNMIIINRADGEYCLTAEQLCLGETEAAVCELGGYGNLDELLARAGEGAEAGGVKTADEAAAASAEPLSQQTYQYTLSEGAKNILLRARQMYDITWTAQEDVECYRFYQNGFTFKKGYTYRGIPYGQPVHRGAYVGFGATIDEFAAAAADPTSKMYTDKGANTWYNTSTNGREPVAYCPYYATDCSSFVSYAWGLSSRITTSGFAGAPNTYKVIGRNISLIQTGFALNYSAAHIILVTNVEYNTDGELLRITTLEQTPPQMKELVWGVGGNGGSLSDLQAKINNSGYDIIKYVGMDRVRFHHSDAVVLDGETYISSVSAPVCSRVCDDAVTGVARTVTDETAVSGYFVHADGIVSYSYTVNGGAEQVPVMIYDSRIESKKAGQFAQCDIMNTYEFTVPTQTDGEYRITVSATTKNGEKITAADFTISRVQSIQRDFVVNIDTPTASYSSGAPAVVMSRINVLRAAGVSLEGWCVSMDGIKSFRYRLDDGQWQDIFSTFRSDVSRANPSYSEACAYVNGFAMGFDASALTNGEHTVTIGAISYSNEVFDICTARISISGSPVMNATAAGEDGEHLYFTVTSEPDTQAPTEETSSPLPEKRKGVSTTTAVCIITSVVLLAAAGVAGAVYITKVKTKKKTSIE